MPVPDYQSLMLPMLRCLSDGERRQLSHVAARLADELSLTPDEREERLESGQLKFSNRVNWTRTYLKQAGLIAAPARSVVQITERGRSVLGENPAWIDVAFLRRYPEFLEFQTRSRPRGGGQIGNGAEDGDGSEKDAETPQEALTRIRGLLSDALASELLERVKAASPQFFEQLVVDLMLAMGYGGSREDAGKAIGKSGDGGIDGVIYEDRLGLDVVYLQAKRWEQVVGRPTVQGFVGSLVGNGASKGVLVTTSYFSKEADQYAQSLQQQKVILIDGAKLTRLMIEYGIGVSVVETFVVKRLDGDYFEI